jgi:hypothetical protein
MRKPLSPEIEQQVNEKYLSGEPVREISATLGVSVGYVSNCIENYSSKLEKNTIDAIHDFYKIIRKLGLHPKDAFSGYAIFSVLSQHKFDTLQIHSFVESVLLFSKQNDLTAEQLVEFCKKLSVMQSNSDVSLEDLPEYYDDLVNKKKDLDDVIAKLNAEHKQSENDLANLLQKKNLTAKQVESTDNVLHFLTSVGLDLSDLNSIGDMLQNAKNENYDLSQIMDYLNQDMSLILAIQEKQSQLSEIETRTKKSLKSHEELLLRHENLTLRHNSMLKAVKSVEYLTGKGISPETIPVWQNIFDSFGMESNEFSKELERIGNKNKLVSSLDGKKSKLTKDIARLEKKKSWVENELDNLKSEISNGTEFGKKNLKQITDHAESQINHVMFNTKKSLNDLSKQNHDQILLSQQHIEEYFSNLVLKLETLLEKSHAAEYSLGKLESLKPLFALVNGKFDQDVAIPQILIILDNLYMTISGSNLDNSLLRSYIRNLREKLLELISHE